MSHGWSWSLRGRGRQAGHLCADRLHEGFIPLLEHICCLSPSNGQPLAEVICCHRVLLDVCHLGCLSGDISS